MKTILVAVAIIATAPIAHAATNNCTNPNAIQEARASLSRAYGGTGVGDDLEAVQLSNVEPNELNDGTPVCTGKVSTPRMDTVAVWNVQHYSGIYQVTVLQAVTPTYFHDHQPQQQTAPATPMTTQQRPKENLAKKIINNPLGALSDRLGL
ncbi:hypothetical protein [Komagataeibacter sp. FNDCR2]|uniref:hypothetical protein n=1 Tax=Komagataeibacter sp. FNDCR2 TaxID=2878682 RepID=UPI001E5FAB1A|nr:hypothetical protein [Komagataeibacter sp. FNDCR2]MCE2575273.1 hypothetical protein [Komagataeibacter sp. FNDCR2]